MFCLLQEFRMTRQGQSKHVSLIYGVYSVKKVLRYVCIKIARTRRTFTKLIYFIIFMSAFVYLNYRYNLPVFHVFRNPNVNKPCTLPVYDIYDHSVDQFFWDQQVLPCEGWLDLLYVDSKGYITMNETAVSFSGYSDIKCEYRYIQRVSESKIKFSSKMDYVQPAYLDGDFVHAECYDSNRKLLYNNLHMNIDSKKVFDNRKLTEETKTNLSVYIIGIDSLSRLIAERKIPKTLNFLRHNLSAYMFKGYTRVGDGSYPNLLPLFTGLKAYGEEHKVGINNIQYMFNNYSEKGCIDMYAEDWVQVATFVDIFRKQPSHHYIQPLFQAIDKVKSNSLAVEYTLKFLQHHNIPLGNTSPMCFGNVYKYQLILQYFKRFLDNYEVKRKFAFAWTNEIGHDFLNMVGLADNDYLEFFKWMKESKKLDNAIMIFMSDHGPRYSEIQNTEVGRISNLLPLFTIVLPDHIKSRFNHIHKNLKINTERMTTAFDVYETLKDILHGDFQKKDSLSDFKKLPRGISLFREIPSSRSCIDADISEHYCPCYTTKNVSIQDERVVDSVHAVVDKINDILEAVKSKCAKVVIQSVRSARSVFSDMVRDTEKERSFSFRSYLWNIAEQTRLRITFWTNPGNALYEATVQYNDKNTIKILGDINRINKYGNQSACLRIGQMRDRVRELYCYCI